MLHALRTLGRAAEIARLAHRNGAAARLGKTARDLRQDITCAARQMASVPCERRLTPAEHAMIAAAMVAMRLRQAARLEDDRAEQRQLLAAWSLLWLAIRGFAEQHGLLAVAEELHRRDQALLRWD